MLDYLSLLILYLFGLFVINLGIWLRLRVLCDISTKNTKIIMIVASLIFVFGVIYYHIFK